jgi:poly(3-hydroxybutyrate) depolymerase
MYHLYEQWQGAKYWQDGVDRMATNIDQAYQQVYTTLCQDVKPASQGGSGVTDVYIAGYSRGAFMAVKLANQARRSCGARVRFVGLVDAVNSGIYNWGNRIIADVDVAVHIRKMSGWEHVLTTRDIAGARRILNPEDINHQTIVCNKDGNDTAWRWTRDELVKYARQAGGVLAEPQRHTTDC